ncbi:hypothetical protein GGR50DRAFT_696113 [Xylaria sp. CBS 124048]|nr:hypothetical protein GGR50DRAFT_696113 [Xylaria sp. CBS 124048]
MTSRPRHSPEVAAFEEKVASTVNTIVEAVVEAVVEVGSSLAALEHNTREIFWWTSWTIGIVLGLFILHLLVRVRTQLVRLNDYQATFQRMWAEDRENEERIRREERRERHVREMKESRTRREDMEASARPQAQEDGGREGHLNEQFNEIGPVPPRGTPEYAEFLNQLRGIMRR